MKDEKQAWQIATQKCILIPLPHRGIIEISGKDRGNFLQGIFTQDVAKNFPTDKTTYGLFTNVKGKVLADAYVSHVQETFFLDVEEFAKSTLLKYLDQYLILLKAEVKDRSSDYQVASLIGPENSHVLQNIFQKVPPLSNDVLSINGPHLFISGQTQTLFQEYRLYTQDLKVLLEMFEREGVMIGSESLYDLLQLEAGVPKLGRDMNENTFPQEVGLEEALNFKKGCFVGAEVLQRIFYQGHVNRTLTLLGVDGSNEPLSPDTPVLQDDQEVGRITASAFSYRWNQVIALVIAKKSALESNAPLLASYAGETLPLVELLKKTQT